MSAIVHARVLIPATAALLALAAVSCGGGDGGNNLGPDETVSSVTVTPAGGTVGPGETIQLAATLKSAAGTVLTGKTIAWNSGDPAVATVSSDGLVTGVAEGQATITAASEGKSGSAGVAVHVPAASVEVLPATGTILNGATVQLAASVKDAGGAPLDRPVVWSSGTPTIATVSPSGLVQGVSAGVATIKATAEGKEGTAAITVRVLDVAGAWTFSETVSDPAIQFSCTDHADMTFVTSGSGFTGSSQQTGQCTASGNPFDNSGPFDLTTGKVLGTAISFVEPGQPNCAYQGTLSGDPPTAASGTVSCVGDVTGLGPVNATGTWQITR